MKTITVDGKTPTGNPFAIHTHHIGSIIVGRSLAYLPHDGIGSITVPMRAECWAGQLYYELTRTGEVTPATARNCFLT